MRNRKGFTLIELLVVIAIIGLLSSLAVVNLNSARGKARDAKRLSDVKQLSLILEMVNTEGTIAASVEGCAAGALTTDCTGPAQISQFNAFADPSTPSTACKKDLVGTCGYSIANSTGDGVATSGNYQICFSLEEASGSLAAGPHAINPGGQFGDCN